MKNNFKSIAGFTLAELLGVITVIAIVALLAIPAVTRNVARGKQNLYQSQLEEFKEAAKAWMALHIRELPSNEIDTSITLGCLKAEGLLEPSIQNPITGIEFPNDMRITIKSSSKQYIYQVEENSGTKNVPIPNQKCHFNDEAIVE